MIYLDARKGSGDLIAYFPNHFAQLAEPDLRSGDVMGVGNGPDGGIVWGVEIKKLDDLLGSLQTGRLAEQLGKMQEDYDAKFLLVEGDFRKNEKTGYLQTRKRKSFGDKTSEFWCDVRIGNKKTLYYTDFLSWLLSSTVCSGTFYLHTTSRQETADTIVVLDRTFTKDWGGHSSLQVFNNSQTPGLVIPSVPMEVASCLAEGVGYKKAAIAAEHFKTVKAMANATVDEWRQVDGFDKVLAQRMVDGCSVPHAMKRRTRRKK